MLSFPATRLRAIRRTAVQVLAVAAVATGIAVVPNAAASASVSAYVWNTGGENLNVRASASTTATVVASLAPGQTVTIDAAYVRERLAELAGNADLSKYIL